MSIVLEEFQKVYAEAINDWFKLSDKLKSSHYDLFILVSNQKPCDFSRSPWINLDKETLTEFRTLAIYNKIAREILSIVHPNGDAEDFFSFEDYKNGLDFCSINATQLVKALDSIKHIVKNELREILNNRTGFEIIFNFLRVCANFLINLLTLGQQPNFFKSSTFSFDKIIESQQQLDGLFKGLNQKDRTIDLENPILVT